MNNLSLFLSSSLIWGTTWFMITFQLGVVAPIVSVVYRFLLASVILFGFILIKRKRLNFSARDHLLIFIQGLLLFGINYWLTYIGITKINSALAAVLSTSIVYFNVLFARLFLGDKIRFEVLIGGTFGIAGVIMIFMPEIKWGDDPSTVWHGIFIVLTGSIVASLGNIIAAKSQRRNIPVIQANALGMGYAGLFLGAIALISGLEFQFELTLPYIGSLIYLALFGSVLAFGAFLTLIGKIGPDKAGYVSLVYPVVAVIVSTIFEGYQWSLYGAFGLLSILLGNLVAMGKYKQLYRLIRPQPIQEQ